MDEFNDVRPREFGFDSLRKEQLHEYDETAFALSRKELSTMPLWTGRTIELSDDNCHGNTNCIFAVSPADLLPKYSAEVLETPRYSFFSLFASR